MCGRVGMGRRLRGLGLRWRRLLLLLGGYLDDESVRVLLSGFLVNVFDVSNAGLLQGEPPPADGAGEVLLARVGQLVALEHPPQVELFITKVADELLTLFVLVAAGRLRLLRLRAAAETRRSRFVFVRTLEKNIQDYFQRLHAYWSKAIWPTQL